MNRADGPACARPVRYAAMTTGPSKHPAGTSNPARTAAGSAGPHPQDGPTSAGQPSTPTDETGRCPAVALGRVIDRTAGRTGAQITGAQMTGAQMTAQLVTRVVPSARRQRSL